MDNLTPSPELDSSPYERTQAIEPMDPVVRDLWADALEGDEYEQGDEVLSRGSSATRKVRHCCLGVLCDLAVKAGIIPAGIERPEHHAHGNTFRIAYGLAEVELVLPYEVVIWAGLNMASPRVNITQDEEAGRIARRWQTPAEVSGTAYTINSVPLETLNDNHHSFKAIAKLIRSSL
jgi:hypothetical protein